MMIEQTSVNGRRVAPASHILVLTMLLGLTLAGAGYAQYTVAPLPTTNGTISPNTVQTVAAGGTVTFSFTPAAGYQVLDVQIDGISRLYIVDPVLGILDPNKTGYRITSYTFPATTAPGAHTILVTFEQLYSLSIGNAGPAQPTFPFYTPNQNAYIVAGTTNPATGLTLNTYYFGDTVTIAFATVNPDYKFGEDVDRSLTMDLQTTPPDGPSFPNSFGYPWPTTPPTSDMYWLVSDPPDPLIPPAAQASALTWITNNALPVLKASVLAPIPQSVKLTVIHGDTTVTAWWTRVNAIVFGTLRDDSGNLYGLYDPTDPTGNIFEPLDSTIGQGIRYDSTSLMYGPAAQVFYEDYSVIGGEVIGIPVGPYQHPPMSILAAPAGNQVRIDITPETGKPGAILFMPANANYTPGFNAIDGAAGPSLHGVVQFGKLQIDRPGIDYQLELSYVMKRADASGTTWYFVPPDQQAVPLTDSIYFNITPAETGHFAWGSNTFGQLGIGLVTPPNPDPNQTGLPLPANWKRTTPPAAVSPFPAGEYAAPNTSQLCPPNPATVTPLTSRGPVGMPGDYTNGYDQFSIIGYPHFIDPSSPYYNPFYFAGWIGTPILYGYFPQMWWGRAYYYPDDSYANGRDMLEPVQPYHQSMSHWWELLEEAFHAVSSGHNHSLALRSTGVLWAWGDNTYGELGLGPSATPTYTVPPNTDYPNGAPTVTDPRPLSGTLGRSGVEGTGTFQANTLPDVTAVAAGFDHTVALKGNGTVWTWGRNNWGQLGLGTQDDNSGGHPAPTQVPGLPNVVGVVAAGDYHSLALGADGSVWAWGYNADGELGNGTRTYQDSPVQVLQASGAPFGAARFTGHTAPIEGAAASPDGKYVLTCSNDGSARLSDAATGLLVRTIGNTGPNAHTGPINAVAFSPDGSMILTGSVDRTAKLWLVAGTFLDTFVDTTIGTAYTHKGSVTSVAFAPNFSSATGGFLATASVDGTAKIWNVSIQSGLSSYTLSGEAVEPPVQPDLVQGMGITSVVFSPNFPTYNRFYTASTDETVKIWAATSSVLPPLPPVVELLRNFGGNGTAHNATVTSLAVLANGGNDLVVSGSTDCTAKLWTVTGDQETLLETFSSLFDGNTGNGTTIPAGHTDAVLSVAIAADPVFGTFVLTGSKDWTVKRWLADTTGATPSGLVDKSYRRHTDWVNAVAFAYKAAETPDVDGFLTASNDLTAVLAKTPVVIALAGGSSHSLAIKEDGTVWAWGYNNFGQLGQGDSDLASQLNPVQVQDPSDPSGFLQLLQVGDDTTKIGVSAGNSHSAAVRDDGTVVCWGSNTYGELALGPGAVPIFSGIPLEALDATGTPISGMQAVSAGWGYTLARGVGKVYAWGHNDHGQLGLDGPGVDPTTLPNDQPSATPLVTTMSSTVGNCPPGDTFGNSPMSTLSARYQHSQMVSFADPTTSNGIMQGQTMTWNVDPPVVPIGNGGGGIVIPDRTMSGATAGTTSQTGVAGETIYTPTSASTGTVTAEPGTTVRLIALPRPGYTFDHWSGYAPSETPQTSWAFESIAYAAKPLTITAHFIAVPRVYTLTISVMVNGVLNPSAGTTTGAGTYNENDIATLAAINNNPLFQFDHWSGDPDIANSTLNPAFLPMTGNQTIVANFVGVVPTPYTLTVNDNPSAGGTIYDTTVSPPKPLPNGSVSSYTQGTLVTLTATPNPGYIFASWVDNKAEVPPQGLSSTTTENTSLPMTGPATAKNITANFSAASGVTYTLTTQALVNGTPNAAGGTITPLSGTAYIVNTVVAVQAIPAAGYAFAGWSSNVVPNGQNPTQGTVLMNQNQTVQANFTTGNLTLSVQSTPVTGVKITSPSSQGGTTSYGLAIPGNAAVNLNAPATWPPGGTLASTYYFVRWTLNGFAEAPGVQKLLLTMVGNQTAVAVYELDATPPAVPTASLIPAPGSIQNAPDTVIRLQVADAESGVDFTKVTLSVEGNVIYNGAAESPAGVYQTTGQAVSGICYRTGTPNDYTFYFEPTTVFYDEQLVHVVVNAGDLAGNVMTPLAYTFTVQMRMFGKNVQVNSDAGGAQHRPATLADPAGNLWMVWDNGSQVWIGESPVGAYAFGASTAVSTTGGTQTAAAIALNPAPTGGFFVVWQDNRSGTYEIQGATSTNGTTWTQFANPLAATGKAQTNPTIAVDSTGKIYAAWEDMSLGVSNIFVTYSTNNGATWQNPPIAVSPSGAAQTHPSLAIDSSNNVYLVWSDARNASASHGTDIFGATSANGNTWTTTTVVSNSFNHTAPALVAEKTGSILHLAWVGNETGKEEIYYSSTTGGLPVSPLTGVNVVDDATDNNGAPPAIAVSGLSSSSTAVAYLAWTDSRNVSAKNPQDTDIYFCEVRGGIPGTNILVNDDTNLATQQNPCMSVVTLPGVDRNGQPFQGQPYMSWEDNRTGSFEIWFAATAAPSTSSALSASLLVLPAGGTVGPLASGAQVVIPAGAVPAWMSIGSPITIAQVVATPDQPTGAIGGAFAFGPSGLDFLTPVTITIPLPSGTPAFKVYNAYWYNPLTGAWSTSGISNVTNNGTATTAATTVSFQTTHFTTFSVTGTGKVTTGGGGGGGGGGGVPPPSGGGGGGGGCFIAASAYEAELPGLGGTLEVNSTGRYLIPQERLKKLEDIRGLRDELLLSVPEGRVFSAWYYAVGPYAATAIRNNDPAKSAIRTMVLNPLSELLRNSSGEAESR